MKNDWIPYQLPILYHSCINLAPYQHEVQTHRVQDTLQRLEVEAEAAGAATDDDSTDADAANATTETNPTTTTTGGDGLSRIANGEAQTLGKVFKISLKF